jgi:hypothetical protein
MLPEVVSLVVIRVIDPYFAVVASFFFFLCLLVFAGCID